MRSRPGFGFVMLLAALSLPACKRQPVEPTPEAPSNPDKDAAPPAKDAPPPVLDSTENLKRICAAVAKYAEANKGQYPLPGVAIPGNPKSQPGLSWRVRLLPFLDQDALFKKFKLDEPWDSPTNKPLVSEMPAVYASKPTPADPGLTHFKAFVGEQTVFPPEGLGSELLAGLWFPHIRDGTANTIMVVESGDAVVWTKPDDIPYHAEKPLPELKFRGESKILVGMCSGSVLKVDLGRVSERTLRNAIERSDGAELGKEWHRAQGPLKTFEKVTTFNFDPSDKARKLDASRKMELESAETYAFWLVAEPAAQVVTVEFTASACPVSISVFNVSDPSGKNAFLAGDTNKAIATTTAKSGKLVAAVPAKTEVWVLVGGVTKTTSVDVKLSNDQ
ncbi:DUF1559 family PulG-like putative transporter [Gemmata sp.]|uniref:DUF1559 family PulG-like putative transporter n=1 Tax=Gemmata sp. TaxID=1914242 RepID=UPI003F723D2B